MKFFIGLLGVLFLLVNCTRGDQGQKKTVDLLSYDSPIKYVYKTLEDKESAAFVDGQPVSWSQLLSQDVALQELQETYRQKALVFSYLWAQSLLGQVDAATELEFYSEAPTAELEELLAKEGASSSEAIKVKVVDGQGDVLAKFAGKSVSWSEFHNAHLSHSKLYQRLFSQRMQRLNGIVVRRYLLKASKAANQGMEQFIQKNIVKEVSQPTEEDVFAFAKKRGISESDLKEQMIERLKEIIKQQARDQQIEKYVAEQLVKEPIPVAFKNPELKVKSMAVPESFPRWGKKGEYLVYFGHWACERCGEDLKSFLSAKKKWSESLQGAFVFSFPDYDRESRMGAEAALCVAAQDKESFWSFLTQVEGAEEGTLEEKINATVKSTSVDFNQFRDCFLAREYQQEVNAHLQYAKSFGMSQVPLLTLKTHVLQSPVTILGIEKELRALGLNQKQNKGFLARLAAFFGF